MRILQIIDSLDLFGGAQKLQLVFAEALAGRGHEITVLSLKKDQDSPFAARLRQAEARLVFLPGKTLFDPWRFGKLVGFLRRENFDVVHTHLAFADILGIPAARLVGTRVVTTVHNERIHKRRYFTIKNGLETVLLRYFANEVIAVGHSAAAANRKRLAGKEIHIVPNSVELPPHFTADELVVARKELAGDPSRPIIITVGRLNIQKGYEDLLNAFKIVSQRFPAAKLLIVGRGGLHNQLNDQIKALGMEQQAELLGLRTDVPRLLAASDLYVNSSLWEGLSEAMLEAMAAGLPVVATRVGDAQAVIVDGAGSLVPPQQPDQLAEAMIGMLEQPEKMRQAGEVARSYVLRNHDPFRWAEKILEIYRGESTPSSSSSISFDADRSLT